MKSGFDEGIKPSLGAFAGFGTGIYVPGGKGSALFNGSNSFLSVAISNVFFPGTNDYTVEWWQKALPGIPDNARVFSIGLWDTANFAFSAETGPTGYAWHTGGAIKSVGNWGGADSLWHHFALVRKTGTLKLYKDGSNLSGAGVAGNENITADLSKYFAVGAETGDGSVVDYSNAFKGNITGFHMVIGTALYAANFQKPTSPPQAVADTKLLLNFTSKAGLLTDSSALSHVLTNKNGVVWDAASPY